MNIELYIGIYFLIGFGMSICFLFQDWYEGVDIKVINALEATLIFSIFWLLIFLYELLSGEIKIKGRKQ